MNPIRRIAGALIWFERSLAVLLMGLLVVVSAANILIRNLLGRTYDWLQVAEPTLVLWIALVGATLALGRGRHIRLELALRFCAPVWRRRARRIAALIGGGIMGLLTVAAAQFTLSEVSLFGAVGWLSVVLPLFFLASTARYLILFYFPDPPRGEVE